MAVSLKNLVARSPRMEDLIGIVELTQACDVDEYGLTDSTMKDLASYWYQPGFNLATDAKVIVTNKGQAVGFSCVWHKEYEHIYTFVCVHPEYRGRGIGTLLLRLVEERARQLVRNARDGSRVTLCGTVTRQNEQAQRLFEREGYIAIQKIWRIEVGTNDLKETPSLHEAFKVDLDMMPQHIFDATGLYDMDAIYIIREYEVYEKELRAGEKFQASLEDGQRAPLAVG
jgi:ribosomal protein S18 acetylase RimI-like enzyme